jgi:hypothetical protein
MWRAKRRALYSAYQAARMGLNRRFRHPLPCRLEIALSSMLIVIGAASWKLASKSEFVGVDGVFSDCIVAEPCLAGKSPPCDVFKPRFLSIHCRLESSHTHAVRDYLVNGRGFRSRPVALNGVMRLYHAARKLSHLYL